jgi:trk system potassium uptake protein TrkH
VALVLRHQVPVLYAVALALCLPLVLAAWDARGLPSAVEARGFLLPALLAAAMAGSIQFVLPPRSTQLRTTEAFLVTGMSWVLTGLVTALPFAIVLGMSPVDALHESVSGIATVGTTVLVGLDALPRSILIWRAILQWLGGMGILVIVLLVGRAQGNASHTLLGAEGVKVDSGRLSLNFAQSARRFLQIYLILTIAQVILTSLLGMPLFDSLAHAMTTVATGGYSPHDESLAFYRNRPAIYPHHAAMEWVVMVFMLAGGINFYVLYRLSRGSLRALWDGLEMRLLWAVVGGATLLVCIALMREGRPLAPALQDAAFEVVSLVSTTGFETSPIIDFPASAQLVALFLMLVGGCAGSTAGGIKLIRVGLFGKLIAHEAGRLRSGPRQVRVPVADGRPIREQAFRQANFMLLLWLCYLGFGGAIVSWVAPDLGLAAAYSTVLSALGGFGPSLASVGRVIALPDSAKLVLILGMLAGRLEILPLLVFFDPRAWRGR